MPEPTLGLIMILRNEAKNLQSSLEPVAGRFDEVIAVDTGSDDGTADLCARMGAKVYDFKWIHDFAAARNFSIEKARADWLFWLDGDNAITPQDVGKLRRRIEGQDQAILWALETVEPRGGQLWQKRCFPRSPVVRFKGRVHEQLDHPPHWPSLVTEVMVRHWGYADPQQVKIKGLYYLDLLHKSLEEEPGDFYTHFQIARCHINLRQFVQAAKHLSQVADDLRAREINPQLWVYAQILWAQACQRLALIDQAADILDQLLEQDQLLGLAHYHRGRLAYAQGQWEKVAWHLSRALELGLDQPVVDLDTVKTAFHAEFFLGQALTRLGLIESASIALSRAVSRQPHNLAARTDLARLLTVLGQSERAKQQLQQVLKLRPEDRRAGLLLAKLEQAA